MSAKLSSRWSYALVLAIMVLAAGFLGVGVRAFTSAVVSHSIFLTALGIALLTLPIYFALRRPRTPGALKRQILRTPRHVSPERYDRRTPTRRGRVSLAAERRSKQLAGFSKPDPFPRSDAIESDFTG
jgi:uncharacterized membrane protein YfcA